MIAILAFSLMAEQKLSVQAKAQFSGAKVQLNQGRASKALKLFKKVLKYHPEHIETAKIIADIYYQEEQDYEKAIEYYNITLENIAKETKKLNDLIAKNPSDADEYKEELTQLESTKEDVKKFKDSSWSKLFNTGLKLYQEEKYEESKKEYLSLYKGNEDNDKMNIMLARISGKLDNFEDEKTYYEKVYELDSTSVEAANAIAEYYLEKEDYENTLLWYERVLNLEPENTVALNNAAVCYAKLGEKEKQLEILSRLIEFEPENISALINLGNYYLSKKEYEKALEYLTRLVALEEDDNYYLTICRLMFRAQDFAGVKEYSQKWMEFNPESDDAKQMYNLVKDK